MKQTILLRKNRVHHSIPIKDIVYLARESGITRVHMADGEVFEARYISYSKLLDEMAGTGLFACNRSTIVNREYVYALDLTNCFVVLKDGWGMLDIGLKYRTKIREEFTKCCIINRGQNTHENGDGPDNGFVIRRHNVYYPIKSEELVRVKYFDRSLHLYMNAGQVLLLEQHPLRMILKLADAKYITQCNRGELVNLLYVEKIDFKTKKIILKTGEKLRLGETYEKQIKNVWSEFADQNE